MPTVLIPEDFEIEILEGDVLAPGSPSKFSFVTDFIVRTVLRDGQFWGKSTELMFVAMEIRTAFKDKKPGDLVELAEGHWNKLCEATKTPSLPYNMFVMISGKAFFDAILKPHEK